MALNITMHGKIGGDIIDLHPKTSIGQVENLQDNLNAKSTITVSITEPINPNVGNWWYKEISATPQLCFTANTAGSTVALNLVGTPTWLWSGQYSRDGITWTTYTPGTTGDITLTNVGDKVYFKGISRKSSSTSAASMNYLQFSMTGSIAGSGNCMSLWCGDNSTSALPYVAVGCRLFQNCTALTAAPDLPATILSSSCYYQMFSGCTSLTTPPALPATTLVTNCYYQMFYGCTALTTPPALPATTLADSCYGTMFSGCTSLTTVPALPATTLASGCYGGMFQNCTSLIVSDTSGTGYDKTWTMPTSGTFTNTYAQSNMFTNCAVGGGRASNNMAGAAGQSYTYYTQNVPVS